MTRAHTQRAGSIRYLRREESVPSCVCVCVCEASRSCFGSSDIIVIWWLAPTLALLAVGVVCAKEGMKVVVVVVDVIT